MKTLLNKLQILHALVRMRILGWKMRGTERALKAAHTRVNQCLPHSDN